MFYETMEDILPGLKVIINGSDGTQTMLPLDSFVTGPQTGTGSQGSYSSQDNQTNQANQASQEGSGSQSSQSGAYDQDDTDENNDQNGGGQ